MDRSFQKEQSYKADFLNQFISIVGSSTYPYLFVLAATNFKEKLDSAVLRDGRIEHHFFVGPMDWSARKEFMTKSLGTKTGGPEEKNVFEEALNDEDKVRWFLPYFQTRTVNFTVAQLDSVKNEIANALKFHAPGNGPVTKEWFAEMAKEKLERYLSQKKHLNLEWNYLLKVSTSFDSC